MKIGKVASKFGITIETLRYWENIGVIPPINKDKAGRRDYDKENLTWVEYVVMMRNAGVNIKNLQQYSRLFQMGAKTKKERKAILETQLSLIDDRLSKLAESRKMLKWKIDHFDKIDENYYGKIKK